MHCREAGGVQQFSVAIFVVFHYFHAEKEKWSDKKNGKNDNAMNDRSQR